MKNKKFNILKTFDVFNSEAISILREKIINLIFVETDNFFIKGTQNKSFLSKIIEDADENTTTISTDTSKDGSMQLSVVGNEKVYNLLSYTLNKYKVLRTVQDSQSFLKDQVNE